MNSVPIVMLVLRCAKSSRWILFFTCAVAFSRTQIAMIEQGVDIELRVCSN